MISRKTLHYIKRKNLYAIINIIIENLDDTNVNYVDLQHTQASVPNKTTSHLYERLCLYKLKYRHHSTYTKGRNSEVSSVLMKKKLKQLLKNYFFQHTVEFILFYCWKFTERLGINPALILLYQYFLQT